MTEFVGLDMEMTFSDHYHEVLSVLEGLFVAIFDGLNAKCKPELEAVRKQFPFDDLRYTNPSLRLTFAEATQLLREHGPAVGAELLAELKAAQAAAEAAGEGERAKELAHNVTEAEKHLATVAGHERTPTSRRRTRSCSASSSAASRASTSTRSTNSRRRCAPSTRCPTP